MSMVSTPELDFWEFVNCARCHLPFDTEGGTPPVPFWLTECGHVVCNNHLNADQSCAQCGAQGIQLIPLQKELESPMSEWFRSVPQALDSVAYATRFQMETLASLARHYKNKCVQQRSLIDRLKNEFKMLKKAVEDLKYENTQLRQDSRYQGVSSDVPNANGKRRIVYGHQHASRAHTNSSPRSVLTPMGPDRLTLPPDHQQPTFAPHAQVADQRTTPHRDRPGSSRFAQQYAYNPAESSQPGVARVSLSHQQAAPRQAIALQTQGHLSTGHAHTATQNSLSYAYLSAEAFGEAGPSSGIRPTGLRGADIEKTQMPPPPAPQMSRTYPSLQQRASFRPPAAPQLQQSSGSHRFVPPTPNRPTGTSNSALLWFIERATFHWA
ncbi:hypothetical protein FOMPIDRAFT_1026888 [Fomitopsis schrenkii]|uniref:RING-type domain-containing protein n=1 Tax=Fomitopsis schrenkii TaxID=2126942 RepID=S8EPI4_FOMSC|nr:hypothetical protein FOMPIDRAFT_1026888 [Fomitopsis schrenkii]